MDCDGILLRGYVENVLEAGAEERHCVPYKMKEHEMGGICSTCGGEEECIQGSGREN
jgi:hypothetical protein